MKEDSRSLISYVIPRTEVWFSHERFQLASTFEHELVHALANLDDAILKLPSNLSFGLFDESPMGHPDNHAKRDQGHQQKGKEEFGAQGHCTSTFICHFKARIDDLSGTWLQSNFLVIS